MTDEEAEKTGNPVKKEKKGERYDVRDASPAGVELATLTTIQQSGMRCNQSDIHCISRAALTYCTVAKDPDVVQHTHRNIIICLLRATRWTL